MGPRAGYVREATRFKATRDSVDVPSRDRQVIENAVANATAVHLPETIARAVFTTILNSSVSFELCVVSGVEVTLFLFFFNEPSPTTFSLTLSTNPTNRAGLPLSYLFVSSFTRCRPFSLCYPCSLWTFSLLPFKDRLGPGGRLYSGES